MRQNTYGSAFGLGSKIDTPSLWAGLGTGQNLGRATDTGWVTGFCYGQGRNEGGSKRGTISRAPNHYRGGERLRVAEKSQQCHKYFLQYSSGLHLLPKDLRFEHGGAKLVSCPVVVLASVQGVQGCAKWGPTFSIYAL